MADPHIINPTVDSGQLDMLSVKNNTNKDITKLFRLKSATKRQNNPSVTTYMDVDDSDDKLQDEDTII